MKRKTLAAAALMSAVAGVAAGCATSSPSASPSSSPVSPAPAASGGPLAAGHGPLASGGGGANARSGPAPGGAAGTVGSVSSSGFTMTTSAGQKVTVKEASSTTYSGGSGAASASASTITGGSLVLVLGTVNSTTVTATQVTVEPPGNKYTASSSQVIKFQRGKSSPSKTTGTIPPGWNEGQGTIVSGTPADQAAEAALAAYPGGVVDRIAKLSSGDYNVHIIGVNWPHHVFLNSALQVIGAE